ncbi:MAG: conjugal transfer protein [Ramlibacter sp.]|nr:conjugal transfer protein [Ramlibacter sp.]
MWKPEALAAAVCALAVGWGPAALAASAIVGATEPTQILNNLELVKVAADGAITAQNMVQQYATQLQQFALQQLNLQKLAGLPAGLGADSDKSASDLDRYKAALEQLHGSLDQEVSAIEQRMAEARLSGGSWSAYVASVSANAAGNQGRAVERLQYEQAVLQQVQRDYEFARRLQDQIPVTVGQQQSLQLLNAQMNRIITQNAKLLEVLSASIRKSSEEDARSAEAATRNLVDRELVRQRRDTLDQRQRAFGGFGP